MYKQTHLYIYIYIYIYILIYKHTHTLTHTHTHTHTWGAFNNFTDVFVRAFEIAVYSWKFRMLLLYILWDDRPIFMISLNSLISYHFCVDDSFIFSSMIRQTFPCVDSQFMVSFGITLLFNNVPLDEEISICADFLYRSPLTSVPSFPESVFVELVEWDTKSVSLSFSDNMYRKVDGISMGSSLGPILANISVGFYEKLFFDRFPKSYIYLLYVDDTYAVFVHVIKLCPSSSGWIIYILI